MHEHTFIQHIISQIPDKEKVISVELEIGDLAGIEPEHLKEHLKEETGWKVEARIVKSKVKCSCGYEGEANVLQRLHDIVIYDCPKCGGEPEVLGGKDIKITNVVYK